MWTFQKTMIFPERTPLGRAADDFRRMLDAWPVWGLLGWQEVRIKYRRSVLGPLWLTLSMGVTIGLLGLLYARLLHVELGHFMPFICSGFLLWGYMASILVESCQCYILSHHLIKNERLPLSMFPVVVFWRNTLILLHHTLVFLVVILIFPVGYSHNMWLAIPGFLLMGLNLLWLALLLGMVSARFRDVPELVRTTLSLVFFLTPVIWHPSMLGDLTAYVWLNPFTWWLDLVRAPLMGQTPAAASWLFSLISAGAGWLLTAGVFCQFRSRIPFWI
ncbi:MAG: ABC transporter permease [Verrucomicrobiae bacterium]|nr:ABC transporter permease [Verrucomicrobiae bacterium]